MKGERNKRSKNNKSFLPLLSFPDLIGESRDKLQQESSQELKTPNFIKVFIFLFFVLLFYVAGDAYACVYNYPSVHFAPTDGVVAIGGTKVYTVTITNNDTAGCAASTFTLSKSDTGDPDLSSSLGSGSTGALNPGARYNTTLTVTAAGTATEGDRLTTIVQAVDGVNHSGKTGKGSVVTKASAYTGTGMILRRAEEEICHSCHKTDRNRTPSDADWDEAIKTHSSTALGSSKWAGSGGWGVAGGKYGEFVCTTCHTAHDTTNIYLIKEQIATPDGSNWDGPLSPTVSVDFRKKSGALGEAGLMGDDTGGHAISIRVCEVCHSQTSYHKYNQATDPGHYNAQDCTGCHAHTIAFGGAGACDACHGAPPGSGTDNNLPAPYTTMHTAKHYDPAAGVPTSYTDDTRLSTVTYYAFGCGRCHSTNSGDHGTSETNGIVDVNLRTGENFARGATATANDPPPGSVTFYNYDSTCSSVYCHSDGIAPYTAVQNPVWGNSTTGECGDCHNATAATPPTRGSHARHVGSGAGQLGLACDKCHENTTTGSTVDDKQLHVNEASNWDLMRTDNRLGGSAAYNLLESGSKSPPSTTYSSCSNIYCHSNAQTSPPGGALTYVSPTWGGGVLACSTASCHGGNTDPNKITTGSHTEHITTATYNFGCSNCHSGAGDETAVHANYEVNVVMATGTYGGTLAPGDAYGTCNNVYCHSNASPMGGTNAYTNRSWGGAAITDCVSCHSNTGGGGTNLSTRHTDHLTNYNYGCRQCHEDTVVDNTTIESYTLHVNAAKDVTWGPLSSGGAAYLSPNCTNIYCHSQGTSNSSPFPAPNVAAAWNQTFADLCVSCHSGDASKATIMATNRHTAHVNNASVIGTNYTCEICHSSVVTGNTTINTYSNHVNRLVNVAFTALNPSGSYSGSTTPGDAVGDCSNVYCHSTGALDAPVGNLPAEYGGSHYTTAAWNGATVDCTGCHGKSTGAGGSNSGYVDGIPDYTNAGAGLPGANSHPAHVSAPSTCNNCHTNTSSNGTAINLASTLHTNGTRDVNFSGAGSYNAGTKECSSLPCHGNTQWGGAAMDCIICHSAALGGGPPSGVRQITGAGADFVRPSRHVSNGTTTEIVTKWDCVLCHLEGQATGNPGRTDGTYHQDALERVNLRNVDNYTAGWAWPKGGSGAVTADRDNMDKFCLSCHDSDTSYNTASPWYVPESGDGRIIWASTTGAVAPRTNVYTQLSDAFTWTEEASTGVANPAAAPLQMVLRASPTNKNEMIAGYVTSGGVLEVLCFNGSTWSKDWTVTVGGTGTTRRFDIAYETNSGDVLVVYVPNAADAYNYRYKLGSSACGSANWPAAGANIAPASTSGTLTWIRLEADPRAPSNVIALAWHDSNSDIAARKWNGTGWGTESAVLETAAAFLTAASDTESFDIAFESQSGDLMIMWGREANSNFWYSTCAAGTDTYSAATSIANSGGEVDHIDLSTNPNTNRILMAGIVATVNDLNAGVWDGTSIWTMNTTLDTTVGAPTAGRQLVATGWLINGAAERGIIAYHDASTNVDWAVLNGTTFTLMADWGDAGGRSATGANQYLMPSLDPTLEVTEVQYNIQMDPINKDRLMLLISDFNSDIYAKRLIMDVDASNNAIFRWTNSDDAGIETTTSTNIYKSWAFAYQRVVGSGNRGGGASTIAVNVAGNGLDTGTVANPVTRRYSPFNPSDTLLYKRELDQEAGTWPAGLYYMLLERKARGRAQRSTEASLNTEAKGLLPDVRGQFNYRNFVPSATTGKEWASHHNLNQFQKRYSTNNTTDWPANLWANYTTKEGKLLNDGTATSGMNAGLHCSDCHLNETNAHGTVNTWYMLSNSSGADTAFNYSGDASPASTDNCVKCHNVQAFAEGGTGTDGSRAHVHNANADGRCNNIAADDENRFSSLGHQTASGTTAATGADQLTCLGCHGGRDFGDIHGTNMRYRVGGDISADAGSITKRYRFMSGASMRWYSPNNTSTVADTDWEGTTDVGCYTLNADDQWGVCTDHGGGFEDTGSTARRARPLNR